ncbi:MAG: phage tail sheath C-terminal domain-containing protein [Pseudomonadota bacterium]
MTTYRTPDVYIEEISVFPPSIAEVETAIPAFIGYTGKATRVVADDLLNIATPIKSLLEFETLFGFGPEVNVTEVVIDEANQFVRSTLSNTYYLYDSLRLFFDNGGGKAYVVSVGTYGTSIDRDDLKGGVDAVTKVDEPTILLFPDAATLGADDLAAVQQRALQQCGNLKDRVTVLDTRNDDALGVSFRNKIGINNLKYGAAYSPWLKVNYSKNIGYADVKSVISKGGALVTLQSLTSDAGLLGLLNNLDNVDADVKDINTRVTTTVGNGKTVASRFGELVTAYQSGKTGATLQDLFGYIYGLAKLVDGFVKSGSDLKNTALKGDIASVIGTTLKPVYSSLIALEKEVDGELSAPGVYTPQWDQGTVPSATQWGDIFGAGSPAASTTGVPASADTDVKVLDIGFAALSKVYTVIASAINGIVTGAKSYSTNYEQNLLDNFSVFANIVKGINNTMTAVPPSGAIAGVFASVDNQRGVWKAPANVSLNSVIEPTYYFDSNETDELNVDAVAGKSINAIRTFAGKGTLVWGARTLAGNDNEWRYVSVRRFFNMVEESIKKSTYWAVFEPNDANTWVKVRGMIENYLTQKWREGALAGATTKEAFFVRVGLGVTMSAQDILEGRMNVEIGMAVVRPAEFIILKFSHKLQTS